MAGRIADRLEELGIRLPRVAAPVANYLPALISGDWLFVSGQLPMRDGKLAFAGKLGADLSTQAGTKAAELCALNILAQAEAALDGDLDRVARVARLGGFVNAAPDFHNIPQVVNGASDLMQRVFGESGRHARAAIGTASLPMGAAVEVEALFALG